MGISTGQALDCFRSDDLIGIGMEADAVRRRLHPEGVVSYSIDGRFDYSSIAGTQNLDLDDLFSRVQRVVDLDGSGILLQGRVPAGVTVAWFEWLFAQVKRRFPTLWLHSLSASEILALASQSGLSLADTLARLKAAGLDSIPGTEPDLACEFGAWLRVHRSAHQLGLPTTAALTFGAGETGAGKTGVGETTDQRVQQLAAIRALQEETGGFTAFLPIAFQPRPGQPLEEPTAVEYLKTLAICRIVLDNIPNIQADWTAQGLKTLQMGLRFGGNDVGSALPSGPSSPTDPSEEDLRRIIRDAGFRPVQRDTLYRTVFLN